MQYVRRVQSSSPRSQFVRALKFSGISGSGRVADFYRVHDRLLGRAHKPHSTSKQRQRHARNTKYRKVNSSVVFQSARQKPLETRSDRESTTTTTTTTTVKPCRVNSNTAVACHRQSDRNHPIDREYHRYIAFWSPPLPINCPYCVRVRIHGGCWELGKVESNIRCNYSYIL